MIDNYNKCSQCEKQKKEENLQINFAHNFQNSQCKDYLQKKFLLKYQTLSSNLVENKINSNKNHKIIKNDNKLDFKEPKKNINKTLLLNKKKRRISKKIILKKKKVKFNILICVGAKSDKCNR